MACGLRPAGAINDRSKPICAIAKLISQKLIHRFGEEAGYGLAKQSRQNNDCYK